MAQASVYSSQRRITIIAVLMFAAFMSYLILRTFAADVPSVSEAELASIVGDVTKPQDEAASNNSFIQFNEESGNGSDSGSDGGTTGNVDPTAPPPTDCNPPTGPDPSWQEHVGDIDLRTQPDPWLLENIHFVGASAHGSFLWPDTSPGGTLRNAAFTIESGDAVKITNDSQYENIWIKMASSGGHADGMQGQGTTNFSIKNITVEVSNSPNVTAALFFQNQLGGGRGYSDIVFTLDCVKLIGTGPYGHDIRFGASNGTTTLARISGVEMDGHIQLGGGSDCVAYVDQQSKQYVRGDCTLIDI